MHRTIEIVPARTLSDGALQDLARAIVGEFGHAFPEWDETAARFELTNADGLPTGYAALLDGEVAGCATLLPDDEVAGLERLTPWLGNVYVVPTARGRGVGAALVGAVERAAEHQGASVLHLITDTAVDWYAARGWRDLGVVSVHGTPMTHMVRELTPA